MSSSSSLDSWVGFLGLAKTCNQTLPTVLFWSFCQRLLERLCWRIKGVIFLHPVLILVWRWKVAVLPPPSPREGVEGRDRVSNTPSPVCCLALIFPTQIVAWFLWPQKFCPFSKSGNWSKKSCEFIRIILKTTLVRLTESWQRASLALFVNILSFRINVRNLSHLSSGALYCARFKLVIFTCKMSKYSLTVLPSARET